MLIEPQYFGESFYDGSNVIEEREPDGSVVVQNVWSAGDGRLIVRDANAGA
jgi:hypothetical protein